MFGLADSIAIGIVVATYPEGQSIDVLLPEDGSRLSNIQVMVPAGSSDTGLLDLPDIGAASDDSRWNITLPVERSLRAVLASYRGIPVCIGFLLPQVSEMTFQRKNFRVDRHASDVYSTINANGDMETYHPSGTYFRIGTSPAHEDLTSQDYDKKWAIDQNTHTAVHVHLVVANAGNVVATVDIDSAGNIGLQNVGNLGASIGGDLNATVSGASSINSQGSMTLTAPEITLNGPVTINGATQANGAVTGSSTITAPTLNGTTDIKFGGKSGVLHQHGNVATGSGITSAPI
ncbi:MAG TPA: hypothetical protein VF472_07400 [Burkholderiaceae bacterium]